MNDMTRLPGVLPNLDRLFGTGLGDVMARAVDLHLRNRIVVYGNKTVVFD